VATRADHYRWVNELVWKVRRKLDSPPGTYVGPEFQLLIAAAQVHATLAGVPDAVERQDIVRQEQESAAVVRAEEGRVRAAGGLLTPVVESPAYGTEPSDDERRRDLDTLADAIRPPTTCRCTGMPHDLGSPGCEQPEARLFPIDPRPKPGPPMGGQR
jgi:hypothetical protein